MISARYPHVIITPEMIAEATRLIPQTRVRRTVASGLDTLSGHLGEFAFAQYFFGYWRAHRVGKNRGESDFDQIEIKTSAFPLRPHLNLLVREDYAQKRHPSFYVQIILDIPSPRVRRIDPGTSAYLCGFATASEVNAAPKRDFGSKFGGAGGYRCHYIPILKLKPMERLFEEISSLSI